MSGSHASFGEFLYDICDGSIWANENETDNILQIIAYFDEFTLTNPLASRSKKHKIGMALNILLL